MKLWHLQESGWNMRAFKWNKSNSAGISYMENEEEKGKESCGGADLKWSTERIARTKSGR